MSKSHGLQNASRVGFRLPIHATAPGKAIAAYLDPKRRLAMLGGENLEIFTPQTLASTVIDLPPSSAWQTRTQTLSVQGSANDSTWTTIVASATYTWNPATGNTVTINFPPGTSYRYVQLSFTANSVQNGAQVSEWQILG